MVNILICGAGGKMGATLSELLADDTQAKAICGVDIHAPENARMPIYKTFGEVRQKVDVIIDFSSPAVLKDELEWAVKNNVPVVLGSTGFDDKQLKYIDDCSKKVAIFKTANFSLGINLLMKLVREASLALGDKFDIEIIEMHHSLKADAPSGTALMLAESANVENKDYVYGRDKSSAKRGKEIGSHAVRGGTIVGEHEIMFAGEDEIVTFSHSARSKKVFAAGAIKAAKFLAGKPAGKYDMQDII